MGCADYRGLAPATKLITMILSPEDKEVDEIIDYLTGYVIEDLAKLIVQFYVASFY